MFLSTDCVVFQFLHISLWSIWNYFHGRREGNSGLLMSRRVKWSEPTSRNINLAAAYNSEGRRKRLKQKKPGSWDNTAPGHWAMRGKRYQSRASQGISHGTLISRDAPWTKGGMSSNHWEKLFAISSLGTPQYRIKCSTLPSSALKTNNDNKKKQLKTFLLCIS